MTEKKSTSKTMRKAMCALSLAVALGAMSMATDVLAQAGSQGGGGGGGGGTTPGATQPPWTPNPTRVLFRQQYMQPPPGSGAGTGSTGTGAGTGSSGSGTGTGTGTGTGGSGTGSGSGSGGSGGSGGGAAGRRQRRQLGASDCPAMVTANTFFSVTGSSSAGGGGGSGTGQGTRFVAPIPFSADGECVSDAATGNSLLSYPPTAEVLQKMGISAVASVKVECPDPANVLRPGKLSLYTAASCAGSAAVEMILDPCEWQCQTAPSDAFAMVTMFAPSPQPVSCPPSPTVSTAPRRVYPLGVCSYGTATQDHLALYDASTNAVRIAAFPRTSSFACLPPWDGSTIVTESLPLSTCTARNADNAGMVVNTTIPLPYPRAADTTSPTAFPTVSSTLSPTQAVTKATDFPSRLDAEFFAINAVGARLDVTRGTVWFAGGRSSDTSGCGANTVLGSSVATTTAEEKCPVRVRVNPGSSFASLVDDNVTIVAWESMPQPGAVSTFSISGLRRRSSSSSSSSTSTGVASFQSITCNFTFAPVSASRRLQAAGTANTPSPTVPKPATAPTAAPLPTVSMQITFQAGQSTPITTPAGTSTSAVTTSTTTQTVGGIASTVTTLTWAGCRALVRAWPTAVSAHVACTRPVAPNTNATFAVSSRALPGTRSLPWFFVNVPGSGSGSGSGSGRRRALQNAGPGGVSIVVDPGKNATNTPGSVTAFVPTHPSCVGLGLSPTDLTTCSFNAAVFNGTLPSAAMSAAAASDANATVGAAAAAAVGAFQASTAVTLANVVSTGVVALVAFVAGLVVVG